MAYELIYTSVPQGLKAGSSGFCTAAYTKGLAANVVMLLESLSAYKPCFQLNDVNELANPVSFVHLRYENSGKILHILSRISFYGTDYTGRTNKLAHHVVCEQLEASVVQAGPASVFRQSGLFRTDWNEPPQLFSQQIKINPPAVKFRKAVTWESYTGDAGWAGVLAKQFVETPDKPVFIIFDPLKHPDTFLLVEEALQLLPPEKRWSVTFNTYFNTLPPGMKCAWRFCLADAPCLKEARRIPGVRVIDLTNPAPVIESDPMIECARSGVAPVRTSAAVPPAQRIVPQLAKVPAQFVPQKQSIPTYHGAPIPIVAEEEGDRKRFVKFALIAGGVLLVVAVVVVLGILFKDSIVPPASGNNESPRRGSAEAPRKKESAQTPPKADKTQPKRASSAAKAKSKSSIADDVLSGGGSSDVRSTKIAMTSSSKESILYSVHSAKTDDYPARTLVWCNPDAKRFLRGDVKTVVLGDVLEDGETLASGVEAVELNLSDDAVNSTRPPKRNGDLFVVETRNHTAHMPTWEPEFELEAKCNGKSLELSIRKCSDRISAKNIICLKTSNGKKICFKFTPGYCNLPGKNSEVVIKKNGALYMTDKTVSDCYGKIKSTTKTRAYAVLSDRKEESVSNLTLNVAIKIFQNVNKVLDRHFKDIMSQSDSGSAIETASHDPISKCLRYIAALEKLSKAKDEAKKKSYESKWKGLVEHKYKFMNGVNDPGGLKKKLKNTQLSELAKQLDLKSHIKLSVTEIIKKRKELSSGKCSVKIWWIENKAKRHLIWESRDVRCE